MYVDAGIDGIFCEFPHSTFDVFTHMGSKAAWPTETEAASDEVTIKQ